MNTYHPENSELVTNPDPPLATIMIPARTARILDDLYAAAGLQGGAADFIDLIVTTSVEDAFTSVPTRLDGACDVILTSYEFCDDDRQAAIEGMLAVIGRERGAE